MNELKAYGMADPAIGDEYEMYKVAEVDKVIAELKSENDRLKEKLESVQASAYADSVDAGMRERRLRRALWLARAQMAIDKQKYYSECRYDGWVHRVNVWLEVERKCRAKAEAYR